MKTYIEISFWMMAVGTMIRLVEMACLQWPHERKSKSLGAHTCETIIGIGFLVWAGMLLWT